MYCSRTRSSSASDNGSRVLCHPVVRSQYDLEYPMIVGVGDVEIVVTVEAYAVRPIELHLRSRTGCGAVALLAAHVCHSLYLARRVDGTYAEVEGVGDVHRAVSRHVDVHRPIQARLGRIATIARIVRLAVAGDRADHAVAVDAPYAVVAGVGDEQVALRAE